ncbi:MAG: spinster family MFS transporter [Planctomycetaceae bacterium]
MTTRNQSYYALAVLFSINLMNFYDRLIPGAVGELIKNEWKLSDTALGTLGTAFVLLYATVGVPLGRIADRYDRSKILAGGVFAWSLLTAGSGLARNFWQLVTLRLAVGVGEATCAPAAASLIGDLFPSSSRARAMSIFMLGLPIGNALSFAISGAVAQRWGWQAAFYIALIPGLACALAALFIKEPARGATESHAIGAMRRDGSPWKLVLSIPTMRWIIVSGALLNFNMYALGSFLVSYMIRVHGTTLGTASFISTAVFGLSGIPGLLIGGWLGDKIAHKRANSRLLLGTLGAVLATPLFWLGLYLRDHGVVACAVSFGLGGVFLYLYYATVYPAIQDVIEPSLRGTAMSLYFFAMYLLGGALGPFGFGQLSDFFTRRAVAASGSAGTAPLPIHAAEGIHNAMHIIPILCAVLAAVLWAASRNFTHDAAKLKDWMSKAAAGGKTQSTTA